MEETQHEVVKGVTDRINDKNRQIKELKKKNDLLDVQNKQLQKALTLAIKMLKKMGYAFGEKEIMEEVE